MKMSRINSLILINCINQIIMIISVFAEVTSRTGYYEENLRVSNSTLYVIARTICGDLEMYRFEVGSKWLSQELCEENFIDNNLIATQPPTVELKCQFKDSVTYTITSDTVTKNDLEWQLVVLVPYQDENLIDFNFQLKSNNVDSGRISTSSDNYTFWSTSISSDGRHSLWLRGPQVGPWNLTGDVYNMSYSVNVTLVQDASNTTGSALFAWNTTDADDICFDLMTSCGGKTQSSKIWPNQKPLWEVRNLPLRHTCQFQVSGKHGSTRVDYALWNCDQDPDCIDMAKAINITIDASETENGWDVLVTWLPPQRTPYSYNVTLHANHVERSLLLPGTAKEVIFKGVEDNGWYYVAIVSIVGNEGIHTGNYAMFPARSKSTAKMIPMGMVLATSLLTALVMVSLMITSLIWWRRRRALKLKRIYFPDTDSKSIKDGVLETIDLESGGSDDKWEMRSERLLLHEVIGEGAFGVVRKGTLAPGGKEVAVKMLKEFPTLEEIRSFHTEIELMKSVGSHPHVVSLVGCCSGRRPLIVVEYCGRGDLLSYLRCFWDVMISKKNAKYYNNNIEGSEYRNDLFKCNFQKEHSKLVVNKLYDLQGICDVELTSSDLLSFCRQIAMGMEFLASNRVVHRDLAARNILVSRDRTLKIADFGLSRDIYEENQYKQKGNGKMPVKWMALESLTRRIYTTQSDVWSFGVVVWEIVTLGGSPYPEVPAARLLRLLRAGYRMPRPSNCSKQLYELMMSCWRAQPRARPTFCELHLEIDALLNSACAQDYLSLEVDPDDARPAHHSMPVHQRYVHMIREKLGWTRTENYERPFRAPLSNHYSSPPASLPRAQIA